MDRTSLGGGRQGLMRIQGSEVDVSDGYRDRKPFIRDKIGRGSKNGMVAHLKVLSPLVEDLLQHLVHIRIQECRVTTRRCHNVVE